MLSEGSLVAGKYRVLHKIGIGGMSTVYLVINASANKQWALKEIRKSGQIKEERVRMSLSTELNILKKLRHKYIPSIVDVLDDGETMLILMDYIDGRPLSGIVKKEGAQKEEDVIRWMKELSEVLIYLHEQDPPILHRDIKPSNVMLKDDGDIVLIDFGTAKEVSNEKDKSADNLTVPLGTPGYAAPEQSRTTSATDVRTDIYSLGATAYHLVTGISPADSPVMKPIREIVPSLSGGLEKIITKCTAADPDKRYQNCHDLLHDLEHYYEFDEAYIREKKKAKTGIIVSAVSAAAALALGIGLLHISDNIKQENYDDLLRTAETATDTAVKEASYKEAVIVDSTKGEAYEGLLDIYLSDGEFTTREEEDYLSVLNDKNGSKTNEQALLSGSDYGEAAYRTGLAYYYYYDGGVSLAKPWFDLAENSGELSEAKTERSRILSSISSYYRDLNTKDKAGDSEGDYRTYFNDLASLAGSDIAGSDNVRTALVAYREITYRLSTDTNEFKKADVTEDEMTGLLDTVEAAIAGLPSDDFDETDTGLIADIEKNVKNARFNILAIYEGRTAE